MNLILQHRREVGHNVLDAPSVAPFVLKDTGGEALPY